MLRPDWEKAHYREEPGFKTGSDMHGVVEFGWVSWACSIGNCIIPVLGMNQCKYETFLICEKSHLLLPWVLIGAGEERSTNVKVWRESQEMPVVWSSTNCTKICPICIFI
ncbi:uncharacterized protein LOC130754704 isoform X1 [Actinidia eriantha]|uniref:uncharacterized protein LOC130754704 isoform X1 n=1 Tax=Actinidia eriantha TaxID=165200 RepID=UPI00258F0F83|nr:uncharacterized protein LOC130754704 isoform X1 [Actinidia eriantha]